MRSAFGTGETAEYRTERTMKTISRFFSELSTAELYEILRVRSEIFVVEQNCVYQDPDGRDCDSLHVFLEENGRVLAYLRSFMKDSDTAQMGRVLTRPHGKGLGRELLRAGIEQIRIRQHPKRIFIEAQCYAAGFYEKAGFRICSETFMEDGIPHIGMMLELE